MIKTKEQLVKRLNFLHNSYKRQIKRKIVSAVNEYLENNDHLDCIPDSIEELSDELSLSGGWIYDRLQGKKSISGCEGYKSSMTKKIRKALGYSI